MSGMLGLIELLFVGGAAFGWGLWELHKLRRDKRSRVEPRPPET